MKESAKILFMNTDVHVYADSLAETARQVDHCSGPVQTVASLYKNTDTDNNMY